MRCVWHLDHSHMNVVSERGVDEGEADQFLTQNGKLLSVRFILVSNPFRFDTATFLPKVQILVQFHPSTDLISKGGREWASARN
jgi:hypothetical protein